MLFLRTLLRIQMSWCPSRWASTAQITLKRQKSLKAAWLNYRKTLNTQLELSYSTKTKAQREASLCRSQIGLATCLITLPIGSLRVETRLWWAKGLMLKSSLKTSCPSQMSLVTKGLNQLLLIGILRAGIIIILPRRGGRDLGKNISSQ